MPVIGYILKNEKYIGDALLQKKYTTDTLPFTKKINRGERPQYYVEESHEPIIPERKILPGAGATPMAEQEYAGTERAYSPATVREAQMR